MDHFIKTLFGMELIKAKSITYLKLIALSVILFTILGISDQAYRIDTADFLLGLSAFFMTCYLIYHKKYLGAVYTGFLTMPTIMSLFFYKFAFISFWFYLIAAVLLVVLILRWKEYRIELPIFILLSLTPIIAVVKASKAL